MDVDAPHSSSANHCSVVKRDREKYRTDLVNNHFEKFNCLRFVLQELVVAGIGDTRKDTQEPIFH
jgi:hypothetical protein